MLDHATISRLSKLSPLRTFAVMAADWCIVVAAICLAANFTYPAVWIVTAAVVATRQHALLVLMHDAAHYRLLNNRKWNDRVSDWLLAWPLLVSTAGYREHHLAHHLNLNTDGDPDWVRKRGKPDWEFPKTRLSLLAVLCRDFFGGGFVDNLRSIGTLGGQGVQWSRFAYYVGIATLAVLFDVWLLVLLLWFLPAFTLLPVILRVRSIAEHFGVEGEHELNSTRNTHPSWWERFVMLPHGIGFHLDHHLYPSVPFYRLKALHKALNSSIIYVFRGHQSRTLFGNTMDSVIREVTWKLGTPHRGW